MLQTLVDSIKTIVNPKVVVSIDTLDPKKEILPETAILHACFQILTDHVKTAKFAGLKQNYQEIMALYDYWNKERPRLLFEEQRNYEEEDRFNSGRIERKRQKLDDEMLFRLIKIRRLLKF